MLRNQLLGLPLDLGVLNIARGRSEGVAPLNVVRQELFDFHWQLADLKPYPNWAEFGFNLKHLESLTNFVAAYGTTRRSPERRPSSTSERMLSCLSMRRSRRNDPRTPSSGTSCWHRCLGRRRASLNPSTCGSAAWPRRSPRSVACSARRSTSDSSAVGEPAERRPLLLPGAFDRLTSSQLEGNCLRSYRAQLDRHGLPAVAFFRPDRVFDMEFLNATLETTILSTECGTRPECEQLGLRTAD